MKVGVISLWPRWVLLLSILIIHILDSQKKCFLAGSFFPRKMGCLVVSHTIHVLGNVGKYTIHGWYGFCGFVHWSICLSKKIIGRFEFENILASISVHVFRYVTHLSYFWPVNDHEFEETKSWRNSCGSSWILALSVEVFQNISWDKHIGIGVPFRTRSKYTWIYLVRLAYMKLSHSIHVWVYYSMLMYAIL